MAWLHAMIAAVSRAAPAWFRRLTWHRLVLGAGIALALPCHGLEANTASRAELEQLPGLGPAKVERLLLARANRPFTDWHDLLHRVAGVGAKGAATLSTDGLTVNGASFMPAARNGRPREP